MGSKKASVMTRVDRGFASSTSLSGVPKKVKGRTRQDRNKGSNPANAINGLKYIKLQLKDSMTKTSCSQGGGGTGEVTYSKHKQFGRKCKHCSDRKRTSLPTARKKKKKLDIDQKSVQSALATFVMI